MAKSNNKRKNGARKSGMMIQTKTNGIPTFSFGPNAYTYNQVRKYDFGDSEKYSFNDVLHDDGSKTYQTFNYGYQTIKNPELVKLVEHELKVDGTGFFYAGDLEDFVNSGKDIYNEIDKAFRVLD